MQLECIAAIEKTLYSANMILLCNVSCKLMQVFLRADCIKSGAHPGEKIWRSKPLSFESKNNITYGRYC